MQIDLTQKDYLESVKRLRLTYIKALGYVECPELCGLVLSGIHSAELSLNSVDLILVIGLNSKPFDIFIELINPTPKAIDVTRDGIEVAIRTYLDKDV